MTSTLRDFRPADFEALCAIDRQCFPPGIAYSRDDIAMALLEPGILVVVAEEPAGLAGFVMARARRGAAHIITIDVLERFRRSGLGTQLMDEAHRRLVAAGARRVRLETAVDNTAAIAFYLKLGYLQGKRLKGYYLGTTDAWEMSKELQIAD